LPSVGGAKRRWRVAGTASPALRSAGLLLACVAIALAPASYASAQVEVTSRPLDGAERARLAQGRLVVRSTTQSRGPLELVGGVSYQVIDASPDEVWGALEDTNEWRRMLPQVAESRQVASRGSERTVYLRQAQGPISASYYLRATYASTTHDLTFSLDTERPHDIRAAWGFMTVRPYGEGQTILCYGAMVDIGNGLLTSMVRGTMHEWLLKVPSTVKRYVEGRGRNRYASR
jgi:hypothetical protein